jgi:mRNA interferase MazF
MVEISQGEIWWIDLAEPIGSAPGYKRPIIIVQGDSINKSKIATTIGVILTSNLEWAEAPGNVFLDSNTTKLSKDSIANVSQIVTVDKNMLIERISKLPRTKINLILNGIYILLGK